MTIGIVDGYVFDPYSNGDVLRARARGLGNILLVQEISPRQVLIIGASGQVGGALVQLFGASNIVRTFNETPVDGFVKFDLSDAACDPQLAIDLMSLCRPEIVCICDGRTWVDGCEQEGDLPHRVNCSGPRAVARAAKLFGARAVYYSTYYVFNGYVEGGGYAEEDPPAPLNVYGASKLSGEYAMLEEDAACLILRTNGVFGPEMQGKNFVLSVVQFHCCSSLTAVRCG